MESGKTVLVNLFAEEERSGDADVENGPVDKAGEGERKGKVKSLSCVRLFATPWTEADQAPPTMGFSTQEYSSGLPLPSPGDLPNPGIEPRSPPL